MKLAYLTNQYPKTSHTFIRREIAAVEAAGLAVERFSVRGSGETLVDPRDEAERLRTRVLLGRGALALLPAALEVALSRPLRFLRALGTTLRLARPFERRSVRALAYLAEACVLLGWSRALGIDHVHVHFSTNPAAVALLCRELGGPSFSFTAHGTADFGAEREHALALKIEGAAFVIAVCEDGRRRLRACAPAGCADRIHVVHCGLDAQFLESEPRGIGAEARLVCVARLSPEKGIAGLLRAARTLADEGLAFELTLVGDGPQRAELEELARDLDLARHVRFAGWLGGAQVRERMLASRALVLPSLSEGLPVVIMEAFALHRPVIGTAVGGIAELVTHGSSGWIVAPGSERELAEAMRAALASTPAALDRMGACGARRVAIEHDVRAEARELVRLFRATRLKPGTSAAAAALRAT